MPSVANHLSTARDNRAIGILLLESQPQSFAWSTTIMFYAGLHLVEAAFAHRNEHCDNHTARNQKLKSNRHLQKIWRHYKPLYDHSLKARYLMSDASSAEQLIASSLGESGVRDQILGHHLHQVEKSVGKILGVTSIFGAG